MKAVPGVSAWAQSQPPYLWSSYLPTCSWESADDGSRPQVLATHLQPDSVPEREPEHGKYLSASPFPFNWKIKMMKIFIKFETQKFTWWGIITFFSSSIEWTDDILTKGNRCSKIYHEEHHMVGTWYNAYIPDWSPWTWSPAQLPVSFLQVRLLGGSRWRFY